MILFLPPDSEVQGLKERLELAEGHIEAGRLLTFYQVCDFSPFGLSITLLQSVGRLNLKIWMLLYVFIVWRSTC